MESLDNLDLLFIIWAFFFQIVLIIHFAIRKWYFKSYTLKYGWLVYALSIPAVIISFILLLGGKTWFFWIGGFLFLIFVDVLIWFILRLFMNVIYHTLLDTLTIYL